MSDGGEQRYVLGYTISEQERLERQAAYLSDVTRDALLAAGLAPGMHVLDVGCGMGDVTLVASRIVGTQGSVTAVDRNPEGLARAAERARSQGLGNVRFIRSELADMEFAGTFDALIGRLVLMYFPDPGEGLSGMLRHVRPGGLVAFQETILSAATTLPPVSSVSVNMARLVDVYARLGMHGDMGAILHRAFRKAGLDPAMAAASRVDPDGLRFCPTWLAHTVRSALPLMQSTGVATAEEVDIDGLEQRIRDEVAAVDAIMVSPTMVTAWARTEG